MSRLSSKKVILVDMDGVLADFEKAFYDAWIASFGSGSVVELADRKSFYIRDDYPIELQSEVDSVYNQEGFFKNIPPIHQSIETLRNVALQGYDVYICTTPLSSNTYCIQEKLEWIKEHLGDEWVKKVIFIKDKSLVQGNYLIDDNPDIHTTYQPTWKQLLFNQPYNQHIKTQHRVDWTSFRELLAKIEDE